MAWCMDCNRYIHVMYIGGIQVHSGEASMNAPVETLCKQQAGESCADPLFSVCLSFSFPLFFCPQLVAFCSGGGRDGGSDNTSPHTDHHNGLLRHGIHQGRTLRQLCQEIHRLLLQFLCEWCVFLEHTTLPCCMYTVVAVLLCYTDCYDRIVSMLFTCKYIGDSAIHHEITNSRDGLLVKWKWPGAWIVIDTCNDV